MLVPGKRKSLQEMHYNTAGWQTKARTDKMHYRQYKNFHKYAIFILVALSNEP
jgi:hypothetical protein